MVNSDDLFYLFQGLTYDHQYFVYAKFPVSAEGLPGADEINDSFAEYENDPKAYEKYVKDTAQKLEKLSAGKFKPHLNKIENILASLKTQ